MIVRDNIKWLMAFVKRKVKNTAVAEDLTQEIFIKAYLAYDNYSDSGHIRAWLMHIARNHLYSYYDKNARTHIVSIDTQTDGGASLYEQLTDGVTPEEAYIDSELVRRVTELVSRLPNRQRQIITYRYFEDKKLSEVAQIMKLPLGSVKSASHYAIGTLRKQLGVTGIPGNTTCKGETTMECKEIYKYLFLYANNTILGEDGKKVAEHIEKCESCASVVSALKKLIPTMVFAPNDEMTHYIINFPELKLSYAGVRMMLDNYEYLNSRLEQMNGSIPENEIWFQSGYGKDHELLGTFDNDGNEIKMRETDTDSERRHVRAVYIKKVFKYMWVHYAYYCEDNYDKQYHKDNDAPDLYRSHIQNGLGSDTKSAVYQAIPGGAENVRIKRGSGVVDCGTYKFPYSERYVAADELITLDYSFILTD